jgi:NhaP-type Na+/H+ or K+/H+ antiporter
MALPGRPFSGQERRVLAAGGLRGAVPLGLALATAEELPHLQGINQPLAEQLAGHLLAMIFLVVLLNQLMQSGWMHRLTRGSATPPPASLPTGTP